MYTDSHCHLIYLFADLDTQEQTLAKEALLTDLQTAKVRRIMAIMCDFEEYDEIVSWSATDKLDIGMSVGLHPCQEQEALSAVSVEKLLGFAHPKIWAFGETGLDYHWDNNKKHAQKHSFAAHIHAGQSAKKPIIIHTRAAYHDTLDILKAENCEHGIIHCFTEDYAFAKEALDMGLYISLSGIITFKKSVQLQEVAKKLPKDRVLIETDSPYLAPVPMRGKPNRPHYVPYVAECLGDLWGMSGEEVGLLTSANFEALLQHYIV